MEETITISRKQVMSKCFLTAGASLLVAGTVIHLGKTGNTQQQSVTTLAVSGGLILLMSFLIKE